MDWDESDRAVFERDEVFKYTSDWNRVLSSRTLGFGLLANQNDPFEGHFHVRIFETSPEHEADEWVNSAKRLASMVREKLSGARGLCLSRTPHAPLMWSHYAAKHAGVCFCFDFRRLYPGRDQYWSDVHYASRLPFVDVFRGHSTDQELAVDCREAILTKSLDWSYEKEFRIIPLAPNRAGLGFERLIPKEDFSNIQFGADALKGVLLGYRMNSGEEAEVRKAVRAYEKEHGSKVLIGHAMPSGEDYTMELKRYGFGEPASESWTRSIYRPGMGPFEWDGISTANSDGRGD